MYSQMTVVPGLFWEIPLLCLYELLIAWEFPTRKYYHYFIFLDCRYKYEQYSKHNYNKYISHVQFNVAECTFTIQITYYYNSDLSSYIIARIVGLGLCTVELYSTEVQCILRTSHFRHLYFISFIN